MLFYGSNPLIVYPLPVEIQYSGTLEEQKAPNLPCTQSKFKPGPQCTRGRFGTWTFSPCFYSLSLSLSERKKNQPGIVNSLSLTE